MVAQNNKHNPARDHDAETVEQLFHENLPHLAEGLGADRAWLWWSGTKPTKEDRAKLVEMGWQFASQPHTMEDGREARWFHACGGEVIRRRRGKSAPEDEDGAEPTDSGSSRRRPPARRSASGSRRFDPLAHRHSHDDDPFSQLDSL